MLLPDEPPLGDGAARWSAGAMDGTFGGSADPDKARARSVEIADALCRAVEAPSEKSMAAFALLLEEASAIDHVDSLLELLGGLPEPLDERWLSFAKWMATTAPDRNSVKYAMALLGSVHDDESLEILRTLGQHEEFTLYATVAVTTSLEDPDPILWELGRSTKGWGRIHSIRFLEGTDDPQIRRWMLVEGHRCWILPEFTARISAETGGLVDALRESPDGDVLRGAGEILRALIDDGAAIADYGDGASAVDLYLDRVREADPRLDQWSAIASIQRGLDRGSDSAVEFHGATSKWRVEQRVRCRRLMARPHWRRLTERGLASDDDGEFDIAVSVAEEIGVDPWPACFRRLSTGADHRVRLWHELATTEDPARMERVVLLAGECLSSDAIMAREPATVDHTLHRSFECVLSAIGRFPGMGHDLILTGLSSSQIRGRNLATRTVGGWGEARWTPQLREALVSAHRAEQDESLRRRLERVLEGRIIEPEEWSAATLEELTRDDH